MGWASSDIQAVFIMNSGILISDLLKVEIFIFPTSDSKRKRQVSWVRFCYQDWNI